MARVRRAIADTERMLLQKTLEHLEPGDHLCCIYETDVEHRSVVAPFLRAGMERHEKVVYVVDSHTPAQIRDYRTHSLEGPPQPEAYEPAQVTTEGEGDDD